MNKTIHFFAQDEGSVKAVWPVHLVCAAWPGVKSRFYAAKYGLEYLGARGLAASEFPGSGRYPADGDIPDLIVTGASMRDSIEKQAIAWARAGGIKALAIVDHGSNFWARFSVAGERDLSVLPDRILAPDEESKDRMSQAGFPPERIVVTGNPGFDSFRPAARGGAAGDKRVILCIMQPEFTAGRYHSDESWFPIIQGLAEKFGSRAMVVVRPHPKEDPAAYRPLEQAGILVDERSDITDLIVGSDIVVGKNSTSLIEAVFRGKAVISLDDGHGRLERLPTERMGLSAVARSENELREWIGKSLLQASVLRKPKRVRYYNDRRNTERAAACLLSMLEQPASKGGEAALPGRMSNG
jgi:hypothetical protein